CARSPITTVVEGSYYFDYW
nr:immunoglobulin heavy chain junction region [Mus musculus]MBK4186759.1 immunoglobulin heavy chain junction region [Mus musculus]